MGHAKDLLARAVVLSCSVSVQEALRRRYLTHKVLADKTAREPEMAALSSLIRPGGSVADIGANVGIYTKALSSLVGDQGTVYAFEPLRNNFQILSDVVARARLNNVALFHAAVGDSSGTREMVIPDRRGLAGYYWAHFASPDDRGRREMVSVLSLDQLMASGVVAPLDFVKCDVEGAELEVLRGGRRLIESAQPGFLIEIDKRNSQDVFEFFFALGYSAFVFDRSFQRIESYQDQRFSNYFFLKRPVSAAGCFD